MSDPFIQVDTAGSITVKRVTYREFTETHGFEEAVQALRDEAELALFSDGSKAIDHDSYNRLDSAGMLTTYVALSKGRMVGFAIVMKTSTPRRVGEFMVTDVMWADPGSGAGKSLLLRILKDKGDLPMFITAPIGGRLANALAHSRLFESTHVVFTSR